MCWNADQQKLKKLRNENAILKRKLEIACVYVATLVLSCAVFMRMRAGGRACVRVCVCICVLQVRPQFKGEENVDVYTDEITLVRPGRDGAAGHLLVGKHNSIQNSFRKCIVKMLPVNNCLSSFAG